MRASRRGKKVCMISSQIPMIRSMMSFLPSSHCHTKPQCQSEISLKSLPNC
jgi:hypothetical protein